MGRLLFNPKQTSPMQTYYAPDNSQIMVPIEGYWFSDDKEMDAVIEHLITTQGFEYNNKPAVDEESKKKNKK